jgi:hypothetical protein
MGWLDDLNKKNSATETDAGPKKHFCWHCAQEIAANNFHRQDTCDHCKRASHACKNCEHYDVSYNNLCRESSADRQVEKEGSNFCDYFKPSTRGPGAGAKSAEALKSAADALFKKK